MNKAKKYFVDSTGDMIGYPRFHDQKTEMIPEPFHAKLKICSIDWLNNGVCFTLKDENGKHYNMNDLMMQKYLRNHEVFIEGNWDFYSQGCAYSIGEIEKN